MKYYSISEISGDISVSEILVGDDYLFYCYAKSQGKHSKQKVLGEGAFGLVKSVNEFYVEKQIKISDNKTEIARELLSIYLVNGKVYIGLDNNSDKFSLYIPRYDVSLHKYFPTNKSHSGLVVQSILGNKRLLDLCKDESKGIIQSIINEVDELHRKNIFHNDIWTDNIMLSIDKHTNNITLHIIDFGHSLNLHEKINISKYVEANKATHHFMSAFFRFADKINHILREPLTQFRAYGYSYDDKPKLMEISNYITERCWFYGIPNDTIENKDRLSLLKQYLIFNDFSGILSTTMQIISWFSLCDGTNNLAGSRYIIAKYIDPFIDTLHNYVQKCKDGEDKVISGMNNEIRSVINRLSKEVIIPSASKLSLSPRIKEEVVENDQILQYILRSYKYLDYTSNQNSLFGIRIKNRQRKSVALKAYISMLTNLDENKVNIQPLSSVLLPLLRMICQRQTAGLSSSTKSSEMFCNMINTGLKDKTNKKYALFLLKEIVGTRKPGKYVKPSDCVTYIATSLNISEKEIYSSKNSNSTYTDITDITEILRNGNPVKIAISKTTAAVKEILTEMNQMNKDIFKDIFDVDNCIIPEHLKLNKYLSRGEISNITHDEKKSEKIGNTFTTNIIYYHDNTGGQHTLNYLSVDLNKTLLQFCYGDISLREEASKNNLWAAMNGSFYVSNKIRTERYAISGKINKTFGPIFYNNISDLKKLDGKSDIEINKSIDQYTRLEITKEYEEEYSVVIIMTDKILFQDYKEFMDSNNYLRYITNKNVKGIFCCGPRLIWKKELVFLNDKYKSNKHLRWSFIGSVNEPHHLSHSNQLNDRSALAYDVQNKTAYFISAQKITMDALATLIKNNFPNCSYAINLDGGASSRIHYNSKSLNEDAYSVKKINGSIRPVANYLYATAK